MVGILRESYILCSKTKKKKKNNKNEEEEEEEEEEERIIHPIMDLWSKLKFIYSECTHTHTHQKKIYIG